MTVNTRASSSRKAQQVSSSASSSIFYLFLHHCSKPCGNPEKATKINPIVGSGVVALVPALLGGGGETSSYVFVKLHCSSQDDDNLGKFLLLFLLLRF
jgi:hypothetical protein